MMLCRCGRGHSKTGQTGDHRDCIDHCNDLSEGIETFSEAEIIVHARHDDTARCLATIPGIGPITASLIAATVVDIGLGKRRGNSPPGSA